MNKGVPTARRKVDNPLVFIVLIAIGVAAVFKVGQFGGRKLGSKGMVSFFGGQC